jgi:cytoskeletal protein CcmA (bactofilin family)
MWNKREDEPVRPVAPPPAGSPSGIGMRREPAAIGPSISVVGDITGEEDLTILGRVKGKVELPQHGVTVGESGRVEADIHAKVVSVAGEVHGNLLAGEQILIRKTATMLGNLTAPRVGLEDGCRFRGTVDMETPAEKSRPVPLPAARAHVPPKPAEAAGQTTDGGGAGLTAKAEGPPNRP